METCDNNLPVMVSLRETAKLKILPARLIRNLVSQGRIPHIRSGRTILINAQMLRETLNSGIGSVFEETPKPALSAGSDRHGGESHVTN